MRRVRMAWLCILILWLAPAGVCRAQAFPTPAYQFTLANVTPDTRAIRRAFAKFAAADAKLETHHYHNGSANRMDMVWDGARYRADVLCLTSSLYGVEDCEAVARARTIAEAFMDELNLSYMPEPVMAKTARSFVKSTGVWLDLLDDTGRVIWMNPILSKTVWPEEILLSSPQYQHIRKSEERDLEAFPSPDDVVLRYELRLEGLALDATTREEPENGTWQLILITVAQDGALLSVELQNASFQVKAQQPLSQPMLDSASATAIAQAEADAHIHQPEKARYDQWLALGGYESIRRGCQLQSVQPCYVRLGSKKAVPAWKCTFMPVFIVDGETRVPEGYSFFEEIFVDATEGCILPL